MTNLSLNQKIEQLLNEYPVILFMKGDKFFPKCGFSKTVVDILNEYQVDYVTFDILLDDEIRSGLKEYSNWPTYPQLYMKGDLIGGCDIIKQLHLNGELSKLLQNG
jgi:Grx4 family monothiol glutaredoxin